MKIDPHSATWKAIAEDARQRIEDAHSRLESRGLPIADTEFERGRIKALRDILALADPPDIIPE